MIGLEHIKKVCPLLILLSALLILVGFLHFTHNLTEAVLSNQWRVYRLNTEYYRSLASTASDSERIEHNRNFKRLYQSTVQKPFFDTLRQVEPELDETLRTLSAEIETITENPGDANHKIIDSELTYLQEFIETHIERQLFTIGMSNNAAGFALLLLIGLIVYLYYHNNQNLRQLENALEEKDFLMKEIHHRVKNNLAMIGSFINLQSDKIDNPAVLHDLKNQIRAISTVHEKLYRDESISQIHFPRYVRELIAEIFYSLSRLPIEIEIDMDDMYIDPDRAVPLGLILSELATNAVKHGFDPELDKNTFGVSLTESSSQYKLVVENSGHPFPEDLDIKAVSSLGLILIQSLVQQLRGTLTLERNPNTRFIISFPYT